METIIGLLFIALPVIFKLIGQRLEKAGKTETAGKVREIAEMFGDDDEGPSAAPFVEEERPAPVVPAAPVMPAVPVMPVVQKPAAVAPKVTENARRQTRKPKAPVLLEEKKTEREKIDPKKLVVYSEIMRPKYTE